MGAFERMTQQQNSRYQKLFSILLTLLLLVLCVTSLAASETLGAMNPPSGGASTQGHSQSSGSIEGMMGDEGNQPPIAFIDTITPRSAQPGETVSFAGHGIDDGQIVAYQWSSDHDGILSTEQSFTITSLSVGRHVISFVVTDDDDATSEPVTQTLIINTPPHAEAGADILGYLHRPLSFDGSGSIDLDGNIISYGWNFGDGTIGSGISPTHTYDDDGVYQVSLTVTDDLGGTDTDTLTATIVGSSPIANAGGPYYGYMNQSIRFNASRSTDLDGTIISYTWDFGDGTSGAGLLCSHSYEDNDTYLVTLTINDNDGFTGSDTTLAVILTPNQPPDRPQAALIKINETTFTLLVCSEDSDHDLLRYYIDWGDNTSTRSPEFPSGTTLSVTHTWPTPGNYTITVTATDEHNVTSAPTEIVITVNTTVARSSDVSPGAPAQPLVIPPLFFGVLLGGVLTVGVKYRSSRKKTSS